MDELLTTREAAELLGVHPETILRNLRSGKLPGAKIGGEWRISRNAIAGMLGGEQTKRPDHLGDIQDRIDLLEKMLVRVMDVQLQLSRKLEQQQK